MSNDTTSKTLLVAFVLCIVCSIVVASAAVLLKPLQIENKLLDKKQNILKAAGLYKEGLSTDQVDALFENIDIKIVDVETGAYLTAAQANESWEKSILDKPENYDQRKAAKMLGQYNIVPSSDDIASIKYQAKYATVYLAKNDLGKVESIILPVHGYGLWSTLYGFLALKTDVNSIVGMGFYEHAETPGLGGEVDNAKWKAIWPGKQAFDAEGNVAISIIKGNVNPNSPNKIHQVDGLAGATLTSRGVHNLIRFWLGENGFGPYLTKLKAEGV